MKASLEGGRPLIRAHQFAGLIAHSMSMDLFAQPLAKRVKLAADNLGIDVAQIAPGRFIDLCRVQVAEDVGGEVPDVVHRPMHVL